MTLLLHLSDIHFRKGEVGTAMDPNVHLRSELLRDAVTQCERLGAIPDAVLVSGDVAFAGDPDEYAYALSWLDQLCRACGTTLAAVFVIPGNHDVVRSIASRNLIQTIHRDIKNASGVALDGLLRGLLTDQETSRLLYEALGPYNNFAGRFFCDLLPPERTVAQRELLLNDGSTLRLSGFNSAFVSSTADKEKDLFIDPACFQLVRERGVEHLVMCHHPYAWLRQGDALKDFLNDVARVHLFGHEHTSRIEPGRDWVRIAASAAHPDKMEPGWEPGYNLLELKVDGIGNDRHLEIGAHVRVWQQRPGVFRAKVDRNGADVFRQTVRLDAWTPSPPVETPTAPAPPQSVTAAEQKPPIQEPARSDPMDTLRDISIRFFKLTLSQKSAIAGKLNLLEEEDADQPDFERFRRVFLRARERGLVTELEQEVREASARGR
jgi:3',5'-cyclic AMP phosphodiesterase CpdA